MNSNNSHDPLDTSIRQHQSTGDPVIDTLIHTRPRADAQHIQQVEDELVALLAREHLPRKQTMQTTQTLSRPFRLQIAPTMVAAMILIAVSVVALLTYSGSPNTDPSSPNTLMSPTATPNGPQSMVAVLDHGTQTIPIEESSALIVLNEVGDVTIRAGSSEDGITVDYDKTAFAHTQEEADAELAAMEIEFVQDNSGVSIDAQNMTPRGDSQSNIVNLTITLPPATTLTITNNVGTIHLKGVTISDLLEIDNNVGDIELFDLVLGAGMEVTTNTGSILYVSDVGSEGSYNLTTNVGDISAVLPELVSTTIEASTEVGSIEGPDTLTSTENLVEADLSGVLGNGGPVLTLRTDVGDVTIQLK